MNRRSIAWAAAAALLTVSAGFAVASSFTVDGRAILRDGAPFPVRGVCYSPTPVGMDPSASPPHGDYYTPDYAAVTDRDLHNLRRMGANLVRLYGWTLGADHTDFLDRCYNDGDRPIHVLVNRWINPNTDWSSPTALAALQAEWTSIAWEVADHPAVLGILLGNEVNAANGNGDDPAFWLAINALAAAVKADMPAKLVGTAVTDRLDQVADSEPAMTALDFWGIQTYRGTSFHGFFRSYAAVSSKPLLITEFGYDAYNDSADAPYPDNAAFTADVVEDLLREARTFDGICAGVCVFAYSDEWWKAPGSPWTQDPGGFPSDNFPDGALNEEWWGIFRVSDPATTPNALAPRALFYRLASYWRTPTPPACTIATTPAGITLAFPFDADLQDMPIRAERRHNGSPWSPIATGPSIPELAGAIPGITTDITPQPDASFLLIHIHDTNPLTPTALYRLAVGPR